MMDTIVNEKPFLLQGIELMSFSILPQQSHDHVNEIFQFNVQQEQKANQEKRLIIIFTTVTVADVDVNNTLANILVACGFEIPAFDDIIKRDKEDNFLIPHDLNISLNRIAIATTRGILYAQLRGSYLQDTLLPIVPIE